MNSCENRVGETKHEESQKEDFYPSAWLAQQTVSSPLPLMHPHMRTRFCESAKEAEAKSIVVRTTKAGAGSPLQ
jgi:hypothetical protein